MEKIKNLSKKVKIVLGTVIVLVLIVGCLCIYYFHGISAVSSKDEEVVVEIPKGSSGSEILNILDDHDLIKDMTCAKVYLKLNDFDFKSNNYVLNKNMDLSKILTILEGNDDEYISNMVLTVIDGTTIPEYATNISNVTGIAYEDIINKWADTEYLKTLIDKYWFLSDEILTEGIYYPLEGYLAPETYYLTSETCHIEDITEMMLDQTEKHLEDYKEAIEGYTVNGQNLSIHQFMTLASIVQRESPANHDDRKLITGIIINRMAVPMRIQSDATVNYGNQETKIDVTYEDLASNNLYNTYSIDGLPVGPISSLSKDLFDDVLNYTESEYYYFFTTQDGSVLYTKTYEEHLQVVEANKWY